MISRQSRLAVLKRRAAEIPTVAIEQVEGEEGQSGAIAAGNGILQAGKARCAIRFQTNELTIDQRSVDRQFPKPLREFRKFRRPVEAAARDEPNLAALNAGEQAVAIVFDLVQPVRSLRSLLYQCSELWPWVVGHRGLARAGDAGQGPSLCWHGR
jgi:hypothetical protein